MGGAQISAAFIVIYDTAFAGGFYFCVYMLGKRESFGVEYGVKYAAIDKLSCGIACEDAVVVAECVEIVI